MRWRALTWFLLSMFFFAAALYFWRLGDEWAARKAGKDGKEQKEDGKAQHSQPKAERQRQAVPIQLLSGAGTLNSSPAVGDKDAATNSASGVRHHVFTNTPLPLKQLVRNDKAILLENALIDTSQPTGPGIPEHLRSAGEPGSYIVQSRGALDDAFRALLKEAGAAVIAYIPNNAYLVRASGSAAQQLAAQPQTQTVLPYEPAYKLKSSLLKLALEKAALPADAALNVLTFPDTRESTMADLEELGAEFLGEDRSPFGPVLRILPEPGSLIALAQLSGVQMLELAQSRILANDLSRVRVGVAPTQRVTSNYLNLTGAGILINVNDTGVDTNHPDLSPRVLVDPNLLFPPGGYDTNGHGTHVAGVIAGSGLKSDTLTNVPASTPPNAVVGQFRGMAQGAQLFSMPLTDPDTYLQETAAQTNALLHPNRPLISNNSWTYAGNEYDLAAASYDAAVRDALPGVTGSQPIIYVFAAGNAGTINTYHGSSSDGGAGGNANTILSPATAKNVITVGAIEQNRNITNLVTPRVGTPAPVWQPITDSSNQVAGFSSRGNVGIGIEGDFGRFKPDVVAPGTFVVSTRSGQWDEQAYYNPTNYHFQRVSNLLVSSTSPYLSGTLIPGNAVQYVISVFSTSDLPVSVTAPINLTRTNQVSVPPDAALSPRSTFWEFAVSNSFSTNTISFDLQTLVVTTNDFGDYFTVLSNLNNSLGTGPPYYYRYESGTSLSAADTSGTLALMQEFFEQQANPHLTNSPALMKALLINGARSVDLAYNFQVNNNINYQGWGLVDISNSLPRVLADANFTVDRSSSMFIFDQNPTNALATGQSHTRKFTLTPDAQQKRLRVTLVWTDPPGSPAASLKLVNDLDLVVTNLDNPTNVLVYFGNDILANNDFNLAWNTNSVPNIDNVNNVENVYLNGPLGSNYSVSVIGRHVNVNAVTGHSNDVVQDYALVVSSGDGEVTNGLKFATETLSSVTSPNVTTITNNIPASADFPASGGFLLHQHVGANTPLQGTNLVALTNDFNALLTAGMTNQWHFYVISNDLDFTNAAFVTFLPNDLSIPRIGVREADIQNATRTEADIDLYVSTNPALTNLDLDVLANAYRSVGRGGTEAIILSNAAPRSVYYIGVKSEDQMAAEYAFVGIFSLLPFGAEDNQRNVLLHGFPVPRTIPVGTPPVEQAALVLAVDVVPIHLRRVFVTNSFTHSLPGNLIGTLSHGKTFDVLNNHTCATDASNNCITNRHDYIYEDNGEKDIPGSRPSDGPGSLREFIGQEGLGVWLLSMVNNFPQGTGRVDNLSIKLEREVANGALVAECVAGNATRQHSIDVPPGAASLTICILTNQLPLELFLRRDGDVSANIFDYHFTINPPGTCTNVTVFDSPPLAPGRYHILILNPNPVQVCYLYSQDFSLNAGFVSSSLFSAGGGVSILDDAVTYAYLTNLTHVPVSSLDVGLLINHPRISDLAVTLISPSGTRILLFEDRGALSSQGLGSFLSSSNLLGTMTPFYTNDFDASAIGTYAPGAVFEGWNVLSNSVSVVPDFTELCLSNHLLVLGDGVVSNTLPTTNPSAYRLSFKVAHAPYIVGMVGWWPFDEDILHAKNFQTNIPPLAADIFGSHDGLLCGNPRSVLGEVIRGYYGDGIASSVTVPRCADLDVGLQRGFSIEGWINPGALSAPPGAIIMSDGFENAPHVCAPFGAGTYVSGWYVESGEVDSPYDGCGFLGPAADTGGRCLDLSGNQAGAISTNFNTVVGSRYLLSFAYSKNPSPANPPGFVGMANIDITGQPTVMVSFATANSYTNLNWAHTSFVFTASAPLTKLQFTSLNPGNAGLYLDSVVVSEVIATNLAGPLVEWNDRTNSSPQGVQFWFSGLPGTNLSGALFANVWDTNGQPHVISTGANTITNSGWQHVALTFDARSHEARIYTNGALAVSQIISTTNFVPRTYGDLYFGYHPSTVVPLTTSFLGGLDEFSIYERALTECEVASIFRVANGGKYSPDVLSCPVGITVELPGIPLVTNFYNGSTWTNGSRWETDTIEFTGVTNPTPVIIRPIDSTDAKATNGFNAALDEVVVSALLTNSFDGMLHFTENTNLAVIPIKFAPSPFVASNFTPVLTYTNGFENATQGVFQIGATIAGSTNDPAIGQRNWTVVTNSSFPTATNGVAVVTNADLSARGSNWIALAQGAIQTPLPTLPGHRYQLSYTVRGPCAVGWWNGDVEPLSRRAVDLIGGNHGAFLNGATNANPGYVTAGNVNTLEFSGMINMSNNYATKIELGDPENLRFTNSFTIEGWIKPFTQTNTDVLAVLGGPNGEESVIEQIFYRGDLRRCLDPYYLAIEQADLNTFHVLFHIENAESRDCGVTFEAGGSAVLANQWQHIAAVFESNVAWTNNPPWPTNQLRIYVNGQLATNLVIHPNEPEPPTDGFTERRPFRDLDPGFSAGVAIGDISRIVASDLFPDEIASQPFRGQIDELSAYARALTDPEIAGIFATDRAGKADLSQVPSQSLAKVRVLMDDVEMDKAHADNAKWTEHRLTFTAIRTNTLLTFESLLPGTALDTVTLTEVPAELNYLPEESLDTLNGEDAYGVWRLEMWDTRASTSNLAQLVQWQLNFMLAPSNPPPVIYLSHGIPYTNNLTANSVQYFVVNVPQWAAFSTNVLQFANQYNTASALPLNVFFDQTNFPPSLASAPIIGPASSGTFLLASNSAPPLVTGRPYYLAVSNPNPVSITFALGVSFDISPLTNCAPATNFVSNAGIPRYFQFDLPTNGVSATPPSVAIWLTGANSNLTMVLSQHLPLPDLGNYDYISEQPCTNDEILMVVTNTTPFPLQTNRWYVGIFNTTATNVPFTIQACVVSNYPVFILLTNDVPYVAASTNQYVAPPGPPRWFFYEFSVTNFVNAILFELYNLSGDADLVLQREVPPTMAPYFDGSFRLDRTPEQIVVRTSFELPDLRGNWLLGIYNNETNNVAYTIRAVTPTNGLLISAQPIVVNIAFLSPPHGRLLQWNGIVGERYLVQFTPSLVPPIVWTTVGTLVATTPCPAFEVPASGAGFYRVVQVNRPTPPQPTLTIQFLPGNRVRISWSTLFPGFTLQYEYGFTGRWFDSTLPVTIEGTDYVVYDTIGPVPKYYRLIQ